MNKVVVLVVLINLPGDLHVDFEVSLDNDGAVQEPSVAVLLFEGEVIEEFADDEIALVDSPHQANHLQFLYYLLLLFVHAIPLARLREGQAENVFDDLVVPASLFVQQVPFY
jgi:hypothetical protein